MSLLGNNVFANPTTPLWSGGGGSNLPENPTFNIVTFEGSGSPPYASTGIGTVLGQDVGSTIAILGADQTQLGPLQATALYAGVEANYPRVIYQSDGIDYQAADSQSYFLASVNATSNGWSLPTVSSLGYTKFSPSTVSIPLATVDPSANTWTLSNVASLTVNPSSTAPVAVELGAVGSNVGLYGLDEDGNPGAEFISFTASQMDLSNVTTINGSAYPPSAPATYPSNRFTTQNNSGASVTSSGINVVGIYWEAPADGRVYANCVCSFTNTSLGTPEGLLTVAANLVVGDGTSIPVCPAGLNTSASAQWEFGVQAGVAYDFVGTAVTTNTGDFAANIATLFISFIPS